MEDHALFVLQPHVAAAHISKSVAIAALPIRAGELRDGLEPIDVASRLDTRGADAANSHATDVEGIALTIEEERPSAATRAADIGGLDLVHLHGADRAHALHGLRTGTRLRAARE